MMDLFNVLTAKLEANAGNLTSITLKGVRAQPPVPSYVYDGSLLPSVPASVLQLLASWLYATFVFVVMGMGAFAVSGQQKLDLDLPPNVFMRRLLLKRYALGLGILAFIPATFSLVHLFTSSLHNFNIYNATNIVFAAVLSYGAKYLSEAMQQCMEESTHLDTCKAVYETLYMCSNRAQRVLACTAFPQLKDLNPLLASEKPTETDYVQQDVFAAPALQDSRHYWGHSPGKGPWLFTQHKSVRTYTGSTVVSQRIHQILNTASFTAQQLHAHADGFITMLAGRMAMLLLAMSTSSSLKGHVIQCGTTQLKLGLLLEALLKINFSRHALDIMCERYICRRTPDSHCDVTGHNVLAACAKELFDNNANIAPHMAGPLSQRDVERCVVWLSYMHLVLLGVDLLRVHINQPALAAQAATLGTYEAGFLAGIMGLDGMAAARAARDETLQTANARAQAAANALTAASNDVQCALDRAETVQRYVRLADLCQLGAELAANRAQTAADDSEQDAHSDSLALHHQRAAAQAAAAAAVAANEAAAVSTKAVAALQRNVLPVAISTDEAHTVRVLAAVPVPAAGVPHPRGDAADAARHAARAKAEAARAHAVAISAAVAVNETRRIQEDKQKLLNTSETAVAEATAHKLVLAAEESAATMLMCAAAAGEPKVAKAAAKAAAEDVKAESEGGSAAALTTAATGTASSCVSAIRFDDIYCLTDMELLGFAAALATLLLAMEEPGVVNSAAAAASPQAATDIAAALVAPAVGTSNMDTAGFTWAQSAAVSRADAKIVKTRGQLVRSYTSIPSFLDGVACLSPADSMHSLQVCLAVVLMWMACGAVVISTLVCRDGVGLASLAGILQSGLVAVMFGLLHRLPMAPTADSMCCRFWQGVIAPFVWVGLLVKHRFQAVFEQLDSDEKAWAEVQKLDKSQDQQLKQVLDGSWLDARCDVVCIMCILAAFAGFLVCFVYAMKYEQDCAPGALEPDGGPTKVYVSSHGLRPWQPFVTA